MLHLATLAPSTLDLLRRIQSQDAFVDTRLVGGAALALHSDALSEGCARRRRDVDVKW